MKALYNPVTAVASRSRLATLGFLVLPLLLAGSGCGRVSGDSRDGQPDPASAFCFDVVAVDGTLHLLFALPPETDDAPMSLFHTYSKDAAASWSDPAAIPADHAPPGRHGRGNDPQLAVSGNRLMAVWTAEGEGPWGSGPLGTAVSENGGRTWSPGPAPSDQAPASETGFRFPAVAADDEGFHAIWIHAVDTERSLRHARLEFGGDGWSEPGVIDPGICACCWNRLEIAGDGTLVALYRDHDPSDMGLATSGDGGRNWELRGRVGEFDWYFEGCPHVGGGLALGIGDDGHPRILASVWTGEDGENGAYAFRSGDLGNSWKREAIPESATRAGRSTDVAILEDGTEVLVWDQPAEDDSKEIYSALKKNGGTSWGKPRRLSGAGLFATHPRTAGVGNTAVVFWTEEDPRGDSRLSWLPLKDPD